MYNVPLHKYNYNGGGDKAKEEAVHRKVLLQDMSVWSWYKGWRCKAMEYIGGVYNNVLCRELFYRRGLGDNVK